MSFDEWRPKTSLHNFPILQHKNFCPNLQSVAIKWTKISESFHLKANCVDETRGFIRQSLMSILFNGMQYFNMTNRFILYFI